MFFMVLASPTQEPNHPTPDRTPTVYTFELPEVNTKSKTKRLNKKDDEKTNLYQK